MTDNEPSIIIDDDSDNIDISTDETTDNIDIETDQQTTVIDESVDGDKYYTDLAREWAIKMGSKVLGEDYSSKHYASEAKTSEENTRNLVEGFSSTVEQSTNTAINTLNETKDNLSQDLTDEKDTLIGQLQAAGDTQNTRLINTGDTYINDLDAIKTETSQYATNASNSAVQAQGYANTAHEYEDNAQIWAEGTDAEVQALGGIHSSKVWAAQSAQGQVQADWNETDSTAKAYILNKPTVDQTFDGTSQNAQSGVAIQGELTNYVPKEYLNTKIDISSSGLTIADAENQIKGSTLIISKAEGASLGYLDATDMSNIIANKISANANGILLRSMNTNGLSVVTLTSVNNNLAINGAEVATQTWVNNQGYTSNTGTVTSVNNIQPDVNGNVTISIPDVSNFVTNSSLTTTLGDYAPLHSNVNFSNLTLDDSATFSVETDAETGDKNLIVHAPIISMGTNDYSLDFTSNGVSINGNIVATQTWVQNQNYLTSAANQDLSNLSQTGQAVIDSKVSKSGDTMTGTLNIANQGYLAFQHDGLTKGTIPSATTYQEILFEDSSNADTWQEKRLGFVQSKQYADGRSSIVIGAVQNVANSSNTAIIESWITQDGKTYCTFPNTERVDGQWVTSSTTLLDGASINNTNRSISMNNVLPNDGRIYEVLFSASGRTGNASGNYLIFYLNGGVVGGTEVCRCITRSASYQTCGGSVILPCQYGTNISLNVISNAAVTNITLIARVYRRVGINT